MASPQPKTSSRSAWLAVAIASGVCAACNGVFAKLTTTELTSSWASGISAFFGLATSNTLVEVVIRGGFFALNLIFNAVMWGLFTRALTLASSTVQVSIINTSANFMVTAVLGWIIFAEKLPPMWWLGAMMLVAGSVVIGRREETKNDSTVEQESSVPLVGADGQRNTQGFKDESDEEEEEGRNQGSALELDAPDDDTDNVLKQQK